MTWTVFFKLITNCLNHRFYMKEGLVFFKIVTLKNELWFTLKPETSSA